MCLGSLVLERRRRGVTRLRLVVTCDDVENDNKGDGIEDDDDEDGSGDEDGDAGDNDDENGDTVDIVDNIDGTTAPPSVVRFVLFTFDRDVRSIIVTGSLALVYANATRTNARTHARSHTDRFLCDIVSLFS